MDIKRSILEDRLELVISANDKTEATLGEILNSLILEIKSYTADQSDHYHAISLEIDLPQDSVPENYGHYDNSVRSFFRACAVFSKLHPQIEAYIELGSEGNITLSTNAYRNDPSDETANHSILYYQIGTFAFEALVLENESLFSGYEKWLENIDAEHSSIQLAALRPIVEEYGVTEASVEIIFKLMMSYGQDYNLEKDTFRFFREELIRSDKATSVLINQLAMYEPWLAKVMLQGIFFETVNFSGQLGYRIENIDQSPHFEFYKTIWDKIVGKGNFSRIEYAKVYNNDIFSFNDEISHPCLELATYPYPPNISKVKWIYQLCEVIVFVKKGKLKPERYQQVYEFYQKLQHSNHVDAEASNSQNIPFVFWEWDGTPTQVMTNNLYLLKDEEDILDCGVILLSHIRPPILIEGVLNYTAVYDKFIQGYYKTAKEVEESKVVCAVHDEIQTPYLFSDHAYKAQTSPYNLSIDHIQAYLDRIPMHWQVHKLGGVNFGPATKVSLQKRPIGRMTPFFSPLETSLTFSGDSSFQQIVLFPSLCQPEVTMLTIIVEKSDEITTLNQYIEAKKDSIYGISYKYLGKAALSRGTFGLFKLTYPDNTVNEVFIKCRNGYLTQIIRHFTVGSSQKYIEEMKAFTFGIDFNDRKIIEQYDPVLPSQNETTSVATQREEGFPGKIKFKKYPENIARSHTAILTKQEFKSRYPQLKKCDIDLSTGKETASILFYYESSKLEKQKEIFKRFEQAYLKVYKKYTRNEGIVQPENCIFAELVGASYLSFNKKYYVICEEIKASFALILANGKQPPIIYEGIHNYEKLVKKFINGKLDNELL